MPNIILCMGDDHGWDETGYNGHPYLKTPVLDEMAATGLRLDNFYSAHPTCSPTRGSVITGRHPNRYGTFSPNCSIRPEEISIAQILKKAGYTCGHFGKWHLGPVKAESPTNPGAMGFDQWLSHDNFFELNPTFSHNGGPPQKFAGESSQIIVEAAIEFISKTKESGQSFFAVVWFGSPHEPYSGLDEDLALYKDLPNAYPDRSTKVTSIATGRPTRRPLGQVLQERYAEITAMDRAIGEMRDWLHGEGLKQNTLLWYCGDNGTPSDGIVTSPFRGHKGMVYEGGIRVPGVIEWPERISRPSATEYNAVTSDILPTICDLVDLPLPNRPLDGISLLPLINGSQKERPSPICFWKFRSEDSVEQQQKPYIKPQLQEGTTPLVKMSGDRFTRNFRNFHHRSIIENDFTGPRAILDGRHKLVIHGLSKGKQTIELFDLRTDKTEKKNLSEIEIEVTKKLKQHLQEWQRSVLNSLTGADY
ncbi:MAG: sulfatase-like hydrolase/transferase [Pirellulales bacterium]